MVRTFTIIISALAFVVSLHARPSVGSQHPSFGEEETRAIEEIVRDLVRRNPEIVLEALRELERRQRISDSQQTMRLVETDNPELFLDPGSPVGGNPDGDVTIVEFFDYKCPYCKRVAPSIRQLLVDDPNIRFIYKEWPILGPDSLLAARGALAAWKQGKYEEFHDAMMDVRGAISNGTITQAAKELGLDVERLTLDMSSDEITSAIDRNMALARKLGIRGTPAFIVGDVLVPGAVALAGLQSLVQAARQQAD